LLKACEGLTPIHVNQGYTRCNLLALNENLFITSDKGICNSLLDHGLIAIIYHLTKSGLKVSPMVFLAAPAEYGIRNYLFAEA
jgi:hypothetical protein